jgi:AcrR family transcriptional regulator
VSDPRPYATLLAKGDDRRNRILYVAQRVLRQNGWRNTTLSQIAREAGVTTSGLLHHFQSKDQLLHAVLEARDAYDDAHADRSGDVLEQIGRAAGRFQQAPDLAGMFAVLLVENLDPEAPLHDRLLYRYQVALDTVSEGIRRGQRAGKYRTDIDPTRKAVEIIAFINGMETSWLLDPSIPLTEVFADYVQSLARQFALPPASS